jgi:prevent-host-death family protein
MAARQGRRPKRAGKKTAAARAGARRWKLEEAKARFSELVRTARDSGPQRVTVHGKDAVVVVAAGEFDRLKAKSAAPTLHDLLARSPLKDVDFIEEGAKSPVREVEL